MLQKTKGAVALLGGVLLAGAFLTQTAEVLNGQAPDPTRNQVQVPRSLIEVLDRNQDGVLSPEEIKIATVSIKLLDTNQDGTVTAEELNGVHAFLAAAAARAPVPGVR